MPQGFSRARWYAPMIAVAVATACKGDQTKKPPPATPVRVAQVSRIDAPVNLLASGVVEPVQSVAVTTQVSGNLLDVLFKEGDFVHEGQELFRIDPRPLIAAVDQVKATLARDQAQADAARKDDERYGKLADMGYVSRSQADQMHATALAAAATVAADQAQLRSAQVNLGFATIRAPISGRTGSVLQRQGNNVSPSGGPLVVINSISPMRVRFPVLEQDFTPLQAAVRSHPLTVTAMSSDSGQVNEQGQVAFLDNNVDSLTGTVTGKAVFSNASHKLWPGEMVYLTVLVNVEHNVLAVPNEAILTGQQGPYVFVVDQKMLAQMRNVTPGLQVGDLTVIQTGVAAGERVVIDGQSRLNPGAKVALAAVGSDTGAAGLAPGGVAGSASGDVTTGRAGQPGSAAVTAPNGGGAQATGAAGAPPSLSPVAPVPGQSATPTPANRTTTTPSTTTTTNPATGRTTTSSGTTTTTTTTAPTTTRATTPTTGATPPGTAPPTTGAARPPGRGGAR